MNTSGTSCSAPGQLTFISQRKDVGADSRERETLIDLSQTSRGVFHTSKVTRGQRKSQNTPSSAWILAGHFRAFFFSGNREKRAGMALGSKGRNEAGGRPSGKKPPRRRARSCKAGVSLRFVIPAQAGMTKCLQPCFRQKPHGSRT